jgi:hypothetical protein
VAEDVPADGGTYAWDVPEDLLSPSTFLIAVDADDPEREAVSERFRARDPWYLHRVVGTLLQPEYEPLYFEEHVWNFDQSDENVWPEAYWDRLYHYYGDFEVGYDPFVEPVPDVRYDGSYFQYRVASDHPPWPAWPAFVRAFGVEGTYASLEPRVTVNGTLRHRPNHEAASGWYYVTLQDRGYDGICYGLAMGLLAAFQDPERLRREVAADERRQREPRLRPAHGRGPRRRPRALRLPVGPAPAERALPQRGRRAGREPARCDRAAQGSVRARRPRPRPGAPVLLRG